jgi:hypothetical protein
VAVAAASPRKRTFQGKAGTSELGQLLPSVAGSNESRLAIVLQTNLWRAEMRRREFIAGIRGTAARPVAAQQDDRVRRIAVFMGPTIPGAFLSLADEVIE